MPNVELPITGGYYVNRSLPISNQRCTNFYVNINQGGGLADESLFGTPGISQIATTGNTLQINRGSHVLNGVPFFVNGQELFRLDRSVDVLGVETFTPVSVGVVGGEGRVSMADNGIQLCVLIPGGNGFIYDETQMTPFQQITDPDFTANGNPQIVTYIDGFFLFTTDTRRIIVSELNDGLSYNALDFGSAEADPDAIVAPIVVNNQLYICGTETIEPFRNIGGTGFPFQRLEGGVISTGVFGKFALTTVAGTFAFIGGSTDEMASAYVFDGSGVQVISTDGIDDILRQLTEEQLANIFAWSYSEAGARFIGFSLADTVIVYDLTSGRWHERSSGAVLDDSYQQFRWRANSVVKAYQRILVGDSIDGRIGELGLDIYDEYGENIVSEVITAPFSNTSDRILVPSVELTVESGVGNIDDPDPVVRMSRSIDGKVWTDERTRPIGKIGQFRNRAIWRRNGRAARFELFRFRMSGKVKKVVAKLEANIL